MPIIGELSIGEKHRYVDEQVRIATSKMFTAFEHGVLEAQLDKERRQRQAAKQITEEYRKRTEATLKASADAHSKLEKAIADDQDIDSPLGAMAITAGCAGTDLKRLNAAGEGKGRVQASIDLPTYPAECGETVNRV